MTREIHTLFAGYRNTARLANTGSESVSRVDLEQSDRSMPIGQTTQALVYVPGAVPNSDGMDNLLALGEAGNTTRLHLEAAGSALPSAQASVAVNSLGLLVLVEIAAAGLTPGSLYQAYLAESDHAPFGKLEALAILKTNPDGAGIVQTIGPLKELAASGKVTPAASQRRFLIVTERRRLASGSAAIQ